MKGIPAVVCGGDRNYSRWRGFSVARLKIRLRDTSRLTLRAFTKARPSTEFDSTSKQEKFADATSNETKKLNKILDSDPGARYIGEFSLGFNPYVLHPMRDILFDEKIAGSFHFTPGQAYENADNGNRSQVHWDLVSIQRPDYGGGEIYFDGKLIRRNGDFLPKQLQSLNRNRFGKS